MGFDMKYDLTYNHFLEKRSKFGNSYLIHEPKQPYISEKLKHCKKLEW